jgi:hypothetical protein
MEEGKSIEIKIVITSAFLAELNKLMPDCEKGKGYRTEIIYFFIREGYLATKNKSQQEPRPNHGNNRDYLRRG